MMALVDELMGPIAAMCAAVLAFLLAMWLLWLAIGAGMWIIDWVYMHYMWRCGMKVFVSGSSTVMMLPNEVKSALDRLMGYGAQILVDDCYGIDSAVQRYLESKRYENVVVYTSDKKPRFDCMSKGAVISCNSEAAGFAGRAYYAVKDCAMARDCDSAIMVWDGDSQGTKSNIERVRGLGKPYKVFSVSSDVRRKRGLMVRLRSGQAQGAPA